MKVKRKILEEIIDTLSNTPGYVFDKDGGQFTGGYEEHYISTNNGIVTFHFQHSKLCDISFESNEEIQQRIANHKNFQQALTDLVNTKVQNANRRT